MEQETRQRKPYQGVQCKLIDFGRGQAMFAAGSTDRVNGTYFSQVWFSSAALFDLQMQSFLAGGSYYPDGMPLCEYSDKTCARGFDFYVLSTDWDAWDSNLETLKNMYNTMGAEETFRQFYDCNASGPFHHNPIPGFQHMGNTLAPWGIYGEEVYCC